MASAIIKGVVSSGFLKGNEIAVFDKDSEKTKALSNEFGVVVCSGGFEIAEKCERIVFAIKPNVLPSVIDEIKDVLKEKSPLIISIAAGKTLDFINSCLSYDDARIIRIMPNINAVALEAICACCSNENATDSDKAFVSGLCCSFGKVVCIDESLFSIYSAIGGCGPAFSYMFIDSLARAGVENGLTKDVALKVAAQTVLGSAKMILESSEHPWQLIDKVCSPGGTTIEGVLTLQQEGFEAATAKAVKASCEKDKKI